MRCSNRAVRLCEPSAEAITSLDDLVATYIREYRKGAGEERAFFRDDCSSLEEAIEFAALCKLPGGKRHPHQRRLPREVLVEAEDALQASKQELQHCQSFDELYQLVQDRILGIAGVGHLTVYDVATRIGAHLNLAPEVVYLHAGTGQGAAALGFNSTGTLAPEDLPKAFKKLRPHEIEDCLCIFKQQLTTLARRT